MRYIYEALVAAGFDGDLFAYVPDVPSCSVRAASYAETLYRLADVLEETLSEILCAGGLPPEPTYGHEHYDDVSVVTLVVSASDEARYRVVSASRAAEMLGVSRPRVSQMLKSGVLQGYRSGRNSWVYASSVEDRLRYRPNREDSWE